MFTLKRRFIRKIRLPIPQSLDSIILAQKKTGNYPVKLCITVSVKTITK